MLLFRDTEGGRTMAKRVKVALLDRLDSALKDMYHNATLHIPMSVDDPNGRFFEYLTEAGSQDIEYIEDGLGVTSKEWKRQERLGFSHNERYFWLVSRITEYGKLYQWGRGGRTVAPNDLVNQRGGSGFRIKDSSYFEETSNKELTDMIQVIEAFNHYVESWCNAKSIQSMYDSYLEYEEELEADRVAHLCPTCGK